ncbi:hypothetical protein BCR44DRAFT_1226824 [Catenaria anguillulae PL171]|uniref:Uncharacterized protein n=1 Tax=Catenaria anguillulae PL171 TaxID=765915 RepID=A0A1Y2HG69_9FUNG|nr:hypothetical protein BCR44DRAFT_1226824 [Catenaria anguillulae PL171]
MLGLSLDDECVELDYVLNDSPSVLGLSTDATLHLIHSELSSRSLTMPNRVEWWDTLAHLPEPELDISKEPFCDVAYVEYAWSHAGELRPISVSHQAILNQQLGIRMTTGVKHTDTLFTHMDMRGIGFAFFLIALYNGSTLIVGAGPALMDVGSLWLRLLVEFGVTATLLTPSCVRRLSVHTTAGAVGPPSVEELQRIRTIFVADDCLHPSVLLHTKAKLGPFFGESVVTSIVRPVCCAPDFGGFVLAIRGAEETESIGELLLDRSSLMSGQVVLVDGEFKLSGMQTGAVPVSSVSFPLPFVSVAILDHLSNNSTLALPNTWGEVCIASPATQGMTCSQFRTVTIGPDVFFKTGLLGTLIDGQALAVFGRIEDLDCCGPAQSNVTSTVTSLIKGVSAALFFNAQLPHSTVRHPVLVLETSRQGAELPSVTTNALTICTDLAGISCYAVICFAPGSLPPRSWATRAVAR